MASIVSVQFERITDSNGRPISGGKLRIFDAGTSDLAAIYVDAIGTTLAANPIIANSAGILPQRYLVDGSYDFEWLNASDVRLDFKQSIGGDGNGGNSSSGEEKRIVTSDWQCVPEYAAQIAAQRALMAEINTYHGDAAFIDFPGDVVDRATDNDTGAAPGYGYPELLADLRTYLPRITTNRVFFIPGNHDRDGTGIGSWRYASSLVTYRSNIGPEYFYTTKGNICRIYMGDMGGSVSGEIADYVIEWFGRVLEAHKLYNVILFLHQPPDDTVLPGYTAGGNIYQKDPSRITDLVNAYDNIAVCYYGHVHSSDLASCTQVTTAYGTTWINVAAGIPTCYLNASGPPGYDIPYCVEYTEEGSTDLLVRRWNSIAHDWMTPGTYDVEVTLKYPAVLGGDTHDYDGRVQADPRNAIVRGPHVVHMSAADFRDSGSPFAVPSTLPLEAQKIIVADDSNDAIAAGTGVGTSYYVPGQTTDTDADGNNQTVVPGYGLGGVVAFHRNVGANQEDYQSHFSVWLRKSLASGHDLEEALKLYPSSSSSEGGLAVPAGRIFFPATQNPSTNANCLDDYEEGSWTPALQFGGAAVGMTYSGQLGWYIKIGKLVIASCRFTLSAKGSSTGNAQIAGLPFTSGTTIGRWAAFAASWFNLVTTTAPQGRLFSSATAITLSAGAAVSVTAMTEGNFANNTEMAMTVIYEAST